MSDERKNPIGRLRDLSKQKVTLRIGIIVLAVIVVLMLLGYIGTDCGICSFGCMSGAEACVACAEACGSCMSCLCA